MNARPTDRRFFRLLLVLTAGLALVGLALAVPLSLAADAEATAATLTQPPQISNGPPQVEALPAAVVGDLPSLVVSSVQPPISNPPYPTSNPQPKAPLSPLAPLAGLINGGFETGNLTGWTVSGSAAHVEALQAINFNPSIAPPEGSYFALLCTGPGIVDPTNTPQGNLDGNLLGSQAYDTSFLSQILTLTDRDVPATLIFDWSFLTSEGTRAPDPYDDFFRIRLNSDIILAGSKPGGSSPFTDVALTEPAASVNSTGSTNGCSFVQGRSAFGTFRKLITDPGTYTLEFLVADQGDRNIDSGLLIDNVRLIPEIDLAITKTATPDPAIAGEPLIYEITVTNNGTGRARSVIVTDTLPLEVEYITDTLPNYVTDTLPSGCTFSTGSGPSGEDQLFCSLGDILGGDSVTFQIEVDVDADALANGSLALVNKAEVDAETPDRNPRNDIIILETVLQDLADLRVVKVSKPDTHVRAGDIFTYTIFVDNLGPSHARNVVLTDTILSSGAFTLLSVTPDPNRLADACTTTSTVTGTLIVCALGESLEPQGDPPRNGRWMIQVQVRANQAQDVNNEVFAFSADPDGSAGPQTATPDPDLSNNRATDFISVLATADLHLTKIGQDAGSNPDGDPYTVLAGESITWTLTISNSGPSTAENVAVVDILPRHIVEGSVSVIAVTPPIGGGQCVVGTPGDPNEPLICNVGNLLPNQYAVVTITADIDPSFVAEQPNTPFANYLPNDAYLTSDTFDPDTDDNVVYDALVEVLARADLVVAKIDQPSSVRAGDPLNYSITISNTGPSTAEDTMLVDQLPAGVTFLNATVLNGLRGSVCEYAVGARQVVCSLGDLTPSPPTVTLLINTLVNSDTPPGPMTNTVTVASVTPDPNLANNTATARTMVSTQVDLEISKTSDPEQVYAGEMQKYSITVVNLGPSDAVTVTVTDTLPVSLTYQIDTNHCYVTGTTPAGAQILLCRYGRQIGPDFVYDPLPPGGVWQFDIYALVDPALLPGTIITNTAFVTSANSLGDANILNNTATSKSRVYEKADLKIVKFGKPEGQVRAGEILTYTVIVDNLGPSWATSVALKDILQASKNFDLIDIESDRAAVCSALVMSTTLVYSNVLVGPNPWPPVTAPPPFGVIPPTGISNVNQRVQIDCTLENPASPAVGDGRLEVLEADGPPNSGRWILTIRVRAPQTQDINNVADVVSAAFDPDPGNNHAEVLHEITDVADLEVTKTEVGEVTTVGCPPGTTVLADQVTAGLSLTYTLVITNNGPSPAENTVLQDRLPPWLVVTGYTATQGECSTGTPGSPADKLKCGLGTIEWHGVVTVTITAWVPSWVPDGAILENDALTYSDIFDPTNENNFTTNLTTVSAWADLAIEKSDNPATVVGGELLNYTIVVTNAGPSDALNVVVVDELPNAGALNDPLVTYLSDTDACYQDPIDTAKLTCLLGDIPAGGSKSFDILVQVNPDVVARGFTTIVNEATVSSETADPCLDNNTTTEETETEEEADIYITKTDIPDPVLAGRQMRYLVTFGNRGPSVARNVTVTDVLPAKFVFNRCEPLVPNDTVVCSVIAGDPLTGQTVSLDALTSNGSPVIPGDLYPGEEYSFYIVVDVESAYVLDKGAFDPLNPMPPNPAENTAYVASDTPDTRHPEDNQFTEPTTVLAEADLEVSKTETPDPSLPDAYLTYDPVSNSFVFTYFVTVRNNGPSDAAVVLFKDTLPPDAEFITWTIPADIQCVFRDDGTVICLVGNGPNNEGGNEPGRLNAGSEISFTITARVDADSSPRTLVNRAEVRTVSDDDARVYFTIPDVYLDGTTPTPDPNPRNNVWIETTTVLNARVRVDKKVFLGNTTGLSPAQIRARCETQAVDDLLVLPNTQVTYCYFVYNEGDTWLNQINLTDTPSGHVETAAGPFVRVIGRVDTPPSEFNTAHAFWATNEGHVAPLAPAGVVHPDGYTYLLATRTVTVDFPADGNVIVLGTNTATVTAVPTTKYSTTLPGVAAASDDDLLRDTLALPVLEDTTKAWRIFEDKDLDGLPSPGDTVKYTVIIPNTGAIAATGVVFTDRLYNYIADDPNDPRVPGLLVNGSVQAAIHVNGRDPASGETFDFDVQPPALAFGETLLLRTQAPGVDLLIDSAQVLAGEIQLGNNSGDDEVRVATRLAIPPKGHLLRVGTRVLPRPVPVTFSLRISYLVKIKDTVPVDTIVLNHGWVTYNEIDLFDQRYPNFDPADPNKYLASNRAANNHAGTAGRAYENPEMPGWPAIPERVEPTNYEGLKFDAYPRDDDDPTWFKVEREAASIGADTRVQLPVINFIADSNEDVGAVIEVQNVGRAPTEAILFLWGDYSGYCPPQDPGWKKAECTGYLEPGAAWFWMAGELPTWAKSGVLVSYDPSVYECDKIPNDAWRPEKQFGGQPLAVEVIRRGPTPFDPDVLVTGGYEGISRAMEGVRDPYSGGYAYYVPALYGGVDGLTSWVYIQNSGTKCTSVELWLQPLDECIRPTICLVSKLAPGETRQLDLIADCASTTGFQGSAYVRASQPLGIVVDNVGPEVLLTYRGVPAELNYEWGADWPYFTVASQVNYGPLIYREYQGWDSKVHVQNLSSINNAKVKVYFLDNSGDIITTLVDWICPRGAQTFFLPLVNNLPGHYVGAVRVESQDWWSPGDPPVPYPRIMSVAELVRYAGPARDEILEGIAYNLFGEDEAYDWQVGEIETWGVRRIAFPSLTKRQLGMTTEIAIQNVVPLPGFTDFAIYLYDQNGVIDTVCEKLNAKQVEYINLDSWGYIPPYFVGSAVISATYWQPAVGLAAVKVERAVPTMGVDLPGDESAGTQGFPIHRPFKFLRDVPTCPGQP